MEVVCATEIDGDLAFLESDQLVEEEVRNDAQSRLCRPYVMFVTSLPVNPDAE